MSWNATEMTGWGDSTATPILGGIDTAPPALGYGLGATPVDMGPAHPGIGLGSQGTPIFETMAPPVATMTPVHPITLGVPAAAAAGGGGTIPAIYVLGFIAVLYFFL